VPAPESDSLKKSISELLDACPTIGVLEVNRFAVAIVLFDSSSKEDII